MLGHLLLAAVLQAAPSPASSAAPARAASAASAAAPAENPAVTKIAHQELTAWQAGKPDWSHYIKQIDDSTVKQVQAFLSSLGPVSSLTFAQVVQPPGVPVPLSVYTIKGKNASAYMILHVNDAGKIDLVYFKPAQ